MVIARESTCTDVWMTRNDGDVLGVKKCMYVYGIYAGEEKRGKLKTR